MAQVESPLNLVVLISGSGSNLQALIDALPTLSPSTSRPARISLVLSNRKSAFGLTRAQRATPPIPTQIFSLATFRIQHDEVLDEVVLREQYDVALADVIVAAQPHLIVLAGFMHILTLSSLNQLAEKTSSQVKIINLHPALPKAFDGANAIQRAWEAGPDGTGQVSETGVMVHEVIPEVDRGDPVVVRHVQLRKGESLKELEARIHAVEHEVIVEGVQTMLQRLVSAA